MRWIHQSKVDTVEMNERARLRSLMDGWWQEFAKRVNVLDATFRGADSFDISGWMEKHLAPINPNLMWEFGPAAAGRGHRLVITCETHCELRPLVAELFDRAPQIDGWEFHQWRPAESQDRAAQIVSAQLGVDLNGVQVTVSVGEDQRIDLTYRWPTTPADRETAYDAAFVATELLLGEQQVDYSVGLIQLTDETSGETGAQHFHTLDRLNPTFAALRASMADQLPSTPFLDRVEDIRWAVLELKPQEAIDYPQRADLVTAITCDPGLFGSTFSEGPFYSFRFSRCDEKFCYVKVDGADVTGIKFPDREEMEEAVRKILDESGAGCLIGSGTGLRYSYLELALTNVDAAIRELRQLLGNGNVPRRSWILFHDADLQDEWVGIYEDSPPPPLA